MTIPSHIHSQVPPGGKQEQGKPPLEGGGGGVPPAGQQQLDRDQAMSEVGEEEKLHMEGLGPASGISLISSHHLMNASGLSPHKVQVMKASLFQDRDEQPRMAPDHQASQSPLLFQQQQGLLPTSRAYASTRGSFKPAAVPGSGLLRSTSLHRLQQPSPYRPPHYTMAPPMSPVGSPGSESRRVDTTSVSYVQAIQTLQSSVALSKQKAVVLVPAVSSLVLSKVHLAADIGLFNGRAFRCGWGSNWTLAHCGTSLSWARPEGAAFGGQGGPFSPSFIPERKCEPLTVKVEKLEVRPEGEDCWVRRGRDVVGKGGGEGGCWVRGRGDVRRGV